MLYALIDGIHYTPYELADDVLGDNNIYCIL